MKAIIVFTLLFGSIIITSFSQIIHVPGDQPTIQEGIEVANEGDTVLVDPGIYGENIIINKHITVASLLLTTGNTSYINQTIIEGNSNSSVIFFMEGLDSTSLLIGFKLINGHGSQFMGNVCGGGVTAIGSSPTLSNLSIAYNNAPSGGGIYCDSTSMILNDINIFNNSALGYNMTPGMGGAIYCINNSNLHLSNVDIFNNVGELGGGIYCSDNSILTFDDINRCDIYSNGADYGKDLFSDNFIELVLDTFSVQYPTQYYVEPLENFSFDINFGEIDQVDADLYVSPDGDNSNSGLIEEEPLKNINYASSIIQVDSMHQRTIHLLDGTYSPESNGESFPVRIFEYCNIKGISENSVILFAESQTGVLELYKNKTSVLSNLIITGGLTEYGGGIYCYQSNATFHNIIVSDNTAWGNGGWGGGLYLYESNIELIDVNINNNSAIGAPNSGGTGVQGGDGGGICCLSNSFPILHNVSITDNHSYRGGGIDCRDNSQPYMKNVLITDNHAKYGGGIHCSDSSKIIFDANDLCNIYLNDADYGDDISLIYCDNDMDVIVDTFSVLLPHDYHTSPIDKFNFDILNGKVEQIDADVYISPDGDNNNSGLTIDEPFKNIDNAIYRIVSNNINQHTVHLLDGTYSPSTNEESFPLKMINNIIFKGESASNVTIDIQGASNGIEIRNLNSIIISDLIITGASGGYTARGIYCYKSTPVLQNLKIKQNLGIISGNSIYGGGGLSFSYSQAVLNSLVISDNLAGSGGGIYCHHSFLELQNVTISDNRAFSPNSGIERGGGILCSDSSTIILLNTIMWNDSTQEIYSDGYGDANEINISWSDIQDGPVGIEPNGNTTVNWFEGNIDENPLYIENGENPYNLAEDSPCVDMGTTDTTGLNVLPIDILGNKRIWDGNGDEIAIIDMGAYEYGSQPLSTNNEILSDSGFSFRNYPNPFNTTTFIEFFLAEKGFTTISVYDLSGKLQEMVISKKLMSGSHQFEWNGKGLPAGIYFLRLETNGISETRKLILIK